MIEYLSIGGKDAVPSKVFQVTIVYNAVKRIIVADLHLINSY